MRRLRMSGGWARRSCVSRSNVGWLSTSALLAGGQVEPHQPGPVGVPVGAEPHAGAVRRDHHRIHAHRVVGAVEHRDGVAACRCRRPIADSSTSPSGVSDVANRSPLRLQSHDATWPGFSASSVSSPVAMSISYRSKSSAFLLLRWTMALPGRPPEQVEHGHRAGERREIDGGGVRVLQVDAVHVPVLVAVAVLQRTAASADRRSSGR